MNIPRRSSSNQSKKFRVKRRTRNISVWLLVTICIVGSIYILSLILSLGIFSITNIQISGIDHENVSSIHATVLAKIQGKYLGLFSRANIVIYPHGNIVSEIKNTYPEIQTVSVERDGLHTIIVDINEKIPEAIVCNTLPDFNGSELVLDDPGSCYFVDDTGFIFKKSPSFSGTIYNRYYIPNLGISGSDASSTALITGYATSTGEFKLIQKIFNTIKQNRIVADAILMKDSGEYELYIRNPGTSSSTVVVYFNTISSSTEQLSNFISFWNHTITTARSKKENVEFDYIDVRYSPNVYHRFLK